jgi:iron complex outermembrane recepter protein
MTIVDYFEGANMKKLNVKFLLGIAAYIALSAASASASDFNIPGGPLSAALDAYVKQVGIQLVYSDKAINGIQTSGVKGDLSDADALSRLLAGTGFHAHRESDAIVIGREGALLEPQLNERMAAAATPSISGAALETVTVTSSKVGGDIQNIPISITALSQEQLTATQTAGGPDLIKQVPNMTFTKTNFSGYSIQIRGIGTQAISVTTDPAVAVALNDTPFIRNHFFEQEFFDVGQVEVLRGPQGTLYGRNATAGVVNVISAKPTDQFEAQASADIGNYNNRRFEGMVNIPIVDDRVDLRIAGEWTKRNGYTTDTTLGVPVDGRDLWSTRVTLGLKPMGNLQADLVWEHFSENDDRLRSGKQLCETANPPTSVNGVPARPPGNYTGIIATQPFFLDQADLSQGCQATSLYAPSAFQVPYGPSLPYVVALQVMGLNNPSLDPYAETTQSTNLRHIQSAVLPTYRAKNDTLEFNATYTINPALTFTSQTGYNQDFLYSTEDYNRFDTAPGIFQDGTPNGTVPPQFSPDPNVPGALIFCDPQLGCSDRLVTQDLNDEHAWQLSQEFRLASNFSGPFNFSFGGNYLHYETEENYYVFSNALTAYAIEDAVSWAGAFNNFDPNGYPNCLFTQINRQRTGGYQSPNPITGGGVPVYGCVYTDPNPIGSLNNEGHNYFLSQNPYELNSYAGFGEAYYNITDSLKLTAGLRWTDDQKHFTDIPSEVLDEGYGYSIIHIENQAWQRFTGRAVLNWTPKLDFTDQTLVYASYAHGYKAGGANPPGASFPVGYGVGIAFADHPATFKPEYIEAFELGTKNTLLDGALTLNGDVFYYNYTGYQISEIVDRTAINNNYNAHVEGAEAQADWEPLPGLKFNFAGGWEDTAAAAGDSGIDLMDRTAGMPWMIIKPFPTQASNCVFPDYVVAAILQQQETGDAYSGSSCGVAYDEHLDPVTNLPYKANPTVSAPLDSSGTPPPIPAGYLGFNPVGPGIANLASNNGEGFTKNLAGHALPNAPPFTVSLGGEYSLPVNEDWIATFRSDFYWQGNSYARIFNDNPYDEIRGYSTTNLTLILTNANGWQVMGYLKNVFNVTAITGDFLNSDDSGLTTNVFLTDPRLFGVRVTKNW